MSANPPAPSLTTSLVSDLAAINPWFGILGLVATVGIAAVEHANELGKQKADPTPENIATLLSKVRIRGEDLIPLRTE